jgi:hypothetical protein
VSDFGELLVAISKLATVEEAACRVADAWVRAGEEVILPAELIKALDELEQVTRWIHDLRKETPVT